MKKKCFILFLILIIFFSGCTKINTTYQLKRNGLIDAVFLIQSPYNLILSSINESLIMNNNLSGAEPFLINNTLVYFFENINLSSDELFFSSPSDELKIDTKGMFSEDTYFLGQTFKFPYYYYNYTIYINEPLIESSDFFNNDELLNQASILDIEYDIVYFGSLVSTNGEELDNNKVRFKPDLTKKNEYYLTFKDFFISNWIGRLMDI